MNTGIQDAVNLGWKLAAAVRGRAPEGLLDTYQAERHPVGRLVLRSSGALVRLALVGPRSARIMRDAVMSTALRIAPVEHRAAGTITGIGIAYGRPHHAHSTVGLRAMDYALAGSAGSATRLYEALREGHFVLIGQDSSAPALLGALKDQVDYAVAVTPPGAKSSHAASSETAATPGAALTLVRPDGYIAWASDESDPTAAAQCLHDALAQWCGTDH
jgi:hypothetical protein